MTFPTPHRFLCFLCWFLVAGTWGWASELAEFQTVFQARRELIDNRLDRELETVREMYAGSLGGVLEAATAAGNLDRVLHVRAFREALLAGEDAEPHPDLLEDATIRRLHETWLRLRLEQNQARDKQMLDLYTSFDQTLETLQRRLTQDGNIQEALAVQTARTEMRGSAEYTGVRERVARLEEEREVRRPPGGALPSQVLAALMPATVLHLSFDRVERIRDRTPDSSRRRNHGEIQGAEWVPQGRRGGAMRFNGRDSRVTVANDESLQITGDQTLAFWIYPEEFETRRNPINKAFGGEATITQEVDGTLNYYHGTAGRNAQPYQGFRMERPIPLEEWTHLAVVRDFSNRKLIWYVNGEAVNETEPTFTEASTSRAPVVIGSGYAGSFRGMLDEVMILNQALTPEQVRALYRALGGE